MAKLVKVFKVLQNNWKKSTVGSLALMYGVNYGKERYRIENLMREYCEVAQQYGDMPIPVELQPRHIVVILNPNANKRKAKEQFDKYCAPLLHLAGNTVTILQTTKEGHARDLVKNLPINTDALVIAGGDGTLSEAITGIMREKDGKCSYKIGIIPLGKTNSVAKSLIKEDISTKSIADATMNVLRGTTKVVDAIRIDVLQDDDGSKPVYGLSGIKWGAYRDVERKEDKYWYFGPLRGYAAVLFSGSNNEKINASIAYTPPCSGCSKCYPHRPELHPVIIKKQWWRYLIPNTNWKTAEKPLIDYMKISNDMCGIISLKEVNSLDFNLVTSNVAPDIQGVQLHLGPSNLSFVEFLKEGWSRVKGKKAQIIEKLDAQVVEIMPNENQESEKFLSIDNEEYEVRPIRITLLSRVVQLFTDRY
uniref:Acylglycerol kinase, mitochondrial n=1 Tax=Clastoptera arizonana TaxID=38151 RepID=A0A1B6E9W4_9HEMI